MKISLLVAFSLILVVSIIGGCTEPVDEATEPQTVSPEPAEPTPSSTCEQPPMDAITFVSNRDGNLEIYLMDIDGSNQRNITNNPADDEEPCWSPDGSKIAFISNRDENWEIYVMNHDGSNQTRLTNNLAFEHGPAWSPDGSQIAFDSTRDGDRDIYVMDLDGAIHNLTNNEAHDFHPTWSPDGSQIMFVSAREGRFEIYVMEADGTKQRKIIYTTSMGVTTGINGIHPEWSPDGSRIVFIRNESIWTINTDGSNHDILASGTGPAWAPDGSQIVFDSYICGDLEIFVMDAEGSYDHKLTDNKRHDLHPAWSPARVFAEKAAEGLAVEAITIPRPEQVEQVPTLPSEVEVKPVPPPPTDISEAKPGDPIANLLMPECPGYDPSGKLGAPGTRFGPPIGIPTSLPCIENPTHDRRVRVEQIPFPAYSLLGEDIEIVLHFRNESTVEPLLVCGFPWEVRIYSPALIGDSEDKIINTLFIGSEDDRIELGPRETKTFSFTWNQLDYLGNQVPPGWYHFSIPEGETEAYQPLTGVRAYVNLRTASLGIGKVLIEYPTGKEMEKCFAVNQSQTVTDLPLSKPQKGLSLPSTEVTITLERVEINNRGVRFIAVATSPDYESYPDSFWRGQIGATYSVDGIVKDATRASRQSGSEGYMELNWGYDTQHIDGVFLDPIPYDASQLTFTIENWGDWQGPWEFHVYLESESIPTLNPLGEEWSMAYGGSEYDSGSCVQQTLDGGYIVVGDTRSYGTGMGDVYLIKIDASGIEEWSRTYGGSEGAWGSSVQQTLDGGYIVVGSIYLYKGPIRDEGVYLIKTDASGIEEWSRTYGGSEDDWGSCVQQTLDGGYIVVGSTESYGEGEEDIYLIKTNASGIEEWGRTYGGSGWDEGLSVQQTSDGGYIVAGETDSYGEGKEDVYLLKTDASGIEEWSRTYGGSEEDWGFSVQQTSDGGYIIAGDTESYGNGKDDVYLMKTDASGIEEWSRTYGGSEDDWGSSVQQTSDGGYIIVGATRSYCTDGRDVYLIKTDASGIEEWSGAYGGSEDDGGYSVQQTSDGGYIIAGRTASYGGSDMDVYVLKINLEIPAQTAK